MANNINPIYTLDGLNVTPSPQLPYDVEEYIFWFRYLRQRYEGTVERTYPEIWNKHQRRTYEETQFRYAYGVVFDAPAFGILFMPCTVGSTAGNDIFRMSRGVSLIGTVTTEPLIIDENCKIIRSMPDVGYGGVGDGLFAHFGVYQICDYFAKKLAMAYKAHDVHVLNSMIANVFMCDDENIKESFAKLVSEIYSGNGSVFAAKKLYDEKTNNLKVQQFNNEVGKNYLADKAFADVEQIMCEFDSMIGIENTNTKLGNQGGISDMQIRANDGETMTLRDLWIKTEQEDIEEAIEAYPQLEGLSVRAKKSKEVSGNDVERND